MDSGKVFDKGSMAVFACSMETRLSALNEEVHKSKQKTQTKGVRIVLKVVAGEPK